MGVSTFGVILATGLGVAAGYYGHDYIDGWVNGEDTTPKQATMAPAQPVRRPTAQRTSYGPNAYYQNFQNNNRSYYGNPTQMCYYVDPRSMRYYTAPCQ